MDTHGGTATGDLEPRTGAPPLPLSIWLFGWSFLPAQVYDLATKGARPESGWPLWITLGIATTTLFAHGVLRARLVRFFLVLAMLVLALPFQVYDLLQDPGDLGLLLGLALTIAQVSLLLAYTRSGWFRWHRRTPKAGQVDAGATLSLVPILMVAVLVGAVSGLVDPGTVTTAFD